MKHKSNCQDKITKTNSILFESLNIVSLIIMMQKNWKLFAEYLTQKVVLLDTKRLRGFKKHEQLMIFSDLNPYQKNFQGQDWLGYQYVIRSISQDVTGLPSVHRNSK